MEDEIEKIKELKDEIKGLEKKVKIKKNNKRKKLRIKSNNNIKANELLRVSNNFARKLEFINDKREENGFDHLSNPKITELIVKHKKFWKAIEQDLIYFNTKLDSTEDDRGFNEE